MANRRSPIPRNRVYSPGPLYRATLGALDVRRRQLGWTHAELEERIDIAERSWSKLLNPDARSGRIPRWFTLERAAAVLFPDGFQHQLSPRDASHVKHDTAHARILGRVAVANLLAREFS
jgi:hypothetical protein